MWRGAKDIWWQWAYIFKLKKCHLYKRIGGAGSPKIRQTDRQKEGKKERKKRILKVNDIGLTRQKQRK